MPKNLDGCIFGQTFGLTKIFVVILKVIEAKKALVTRVESILELEVELCVKKI